MTTLRQLAYGGAEHICLTETFQGPEILKIKNICLINYGENVL